MLDKDGNPRAECFHSCSVCKKPLHSFVSCAAVLTTPEGDYFCSQACASEKGFKEFLCSDARPDCSQEEMLKKGPAGDGTAVE